ncbi:mitochondrial succinate-fumarate transporter [Cyberlindnera jadinii NRRL Y-1542]|uniref:Mitochondrial succinate-fumarate transporter n=1 Tax=Cyberlindnera jadinii (strain ATCC 18201 / CBS 1600 / BCRC 20928 / JCM 3617 / NBRC 0987 / NRRL Y-1542) TaxID=983966 RepID=A0A1E4RUN5_CYBJN|nr:mitochondrial succinate-fumarate transporter [Cyberlindnera jadinii NRRL Y-1542]ODV70989.1 mitochondrial succinate-fumarate transporter [Cyberlindnera jadinii NRRL Y-1542]
MSQKKKSSSTAVNLISGGTAGLFEALCCHPLDTIKVRMQLHRKSGAVKNPGFVTTGIQIAKKEGITGLYKGLGAVVIGIIPKMAIRFSSYEFYRGLLKDENGNISTGSTFIAGVGAGITEACAVVNPMEVVKIRLQAQHHSMSDPLSVPKYRNAGHAVYVIVKEEGFGTLYRGVSLTAARQATNQGANFTVYSKLKEFLEDYHTKNGNNGVIPSWQTSCIGLVSGAIGPFSNAPLDTIKTRLQKETKSSDPNDPLLKQSSAQRILRITKDLIREEGVAALYKGITPRVMRVAPGQAVTFTVYEYVRGGLEKMPLFTTEEAVIFDE